MFNIDKYIDKIYYINLDKRTDRRAEIESELLLYGLCGERFQAFEHSNGIVGCGKSHLQVLKNAKKEEFKNVLILEDDFTFLVPKDEFETLITNFFDCNIPYDVCMLTTNLPILCPIVNNAPFLSKVSDLHNAAGYIVNNHYLDKLISLYEYNIPLLEQTGKHWIYANDACWKQLQAIDNWYVFNPRLGKQRPSYSDNSNSFADYK
jgi:glycosyl transferase family 25